MLQFVTDAQLLQERHSEKYARVAAARAALSPVFGKSRVTVHAGSRTEYGYPDDTTHFLYIGLRPVSSRTIVVSGAHIYLMCPFLLLKNLTSKSKKDLQSRPSFVPRLCITTELG